MINKQEFVTILKDLFKDGAIKIRHGTEIEWGSEYSFIQVTIGSEVVSKVRTCIGSIYDNNDI